MSYHEDFLFYNESYLNDTRGYPKPKTCVIRDYAQFPLSDTARDAEIARIEALGYREVEVRTKHQTTGWTYRHEYWGVK